MPTNLKNLASIEDIKLLLARAENHNLYVDRDDEGVWETRHIEAFLLQATILEGVLVNLGLKLLDSKPNLSALKGKRCNRYGYDNAINDLYLLGIINTEEFERLEQFKTKRNEYIHNLLSKDIKIIESEVYEIYENHKNLVLDMVAKLEKRLRKSKK